MGGKAAAKPLLQGALRGESVEPKGVVGIGAEGGGRVGKSSSSISYSFSNRRARGGGYGGEKVDVKYDDDTLGEGGEGGFWVGASIGGFHVAGGGTDTQGDRGILFYRPCGGAVEGSVGDSKSPAHSLHRLPRLPP